MLMKRPQFSLATLLWAFAVLGGSSALSDALVGISNAESSLRFKWQLAAGSVVLVIGMVGFGCSLWRKTEK
jgi:hypothetical protein